MEVTASVHSRLSKIHRNEENAYAVALRVHVGALPYFKGSKGNNVWSVF